jgi:hypothetical protein
MRCMACGTKGAFWCDSCELAYVQAIREVRAVASFMGGEYAEGSYVLAAQRLVVESSDPALTSVGKVDMLIRSRQLLADVEDYFRYTPVCRVCGRHKMVLVAGSEPAVTCTGGCEYG